MKKINAVDQKKVGKAGKTTVITHVVTKQKKRVGQLTEKEKNFPIHLCFGQALY